MKNNISLTTYEITIPSFDSSTTKNFSFNSSVGGNLFSFRFLYDNVAERWSSWVTMPDGTIRLLGVIPSVMNWSRYMDYSIMFAFSGQNIGLGDLINASILVIEWKQ
jgi:hypothetical protein